jgi:hypothetical protein
VKYQTTKKETESRQLFQKYNEAKMMVLNLKFCSCKKVYLIVLIFNLQFVNFDSVI